jgi:hypothetical protein
MAIGRLEEGAENVFKIKSFLGAGRGGRKKILNSPQTHPPSGSHQKIQNGVFGMLHSWVLGHSSQSVPDNRQRSVRVS